MSKRDMNDDEELNFRRGTSVMAEVEEAPDYSYDAKQPMLCGFLSIQYYQPYFDVDTADVLARLLHTVSFCRRTQSFLSLVGSNPDMYGPFWISTTLIFTIGVTSHINSWLESWMAGSTWVYDFQTILTSISVVYSYAFFAPTAIWGILRQYDKSIKFSTMLSLYGYSQITFIPAIFMNLVPAPLVSWLSLFASAMFSGFFLLKNLAPYIVTNAKNQAALLLAFVIILQLVYMLSLKLYFF